MGLRSVSTLLEGLGDAVWRADALADAVDAGRVLPSQHAALDAQLPGGGWPIGAMCEVLQAQAGQAEWRLLLPALRTLTQAVVLVAPPYAPFGPGLAAQGLDVRQLLCIQADTQAQQLWAAEQALRCAGVGAVLLWLTQARADLLRRLHLSAQTQAKLLWVMRLETAQQEASPAVLRLRVTPGTDDALAVQILKRRGSPLLQTLHLPTHPATLRALLAVGQTLSERAHALDRLAAAA